MGSELDKALKGIKDKYGAMAATTVNSREKVDIEAIPSGSLTLDRALGVGGYPRGRIIELFGWESSGKTTLALHALANAQAQGGKVAMVDAEHAFDPIYGEALGLDLDEMIISQPDSGEQALEIAERLISSGEIAAILIDSVTALVPQSEINGEMGDASVGVQARMMSQAMRKLTPIASRTGTTVFFINQLREKIGVMFGNPQTTTGGNALKFYATQRVEVKRKSQPVKDGAGDATASTTECIVIKNKVAPPFKKAHFDIKYGVGIDRISEVFDMAVDAEIITKAGSHFSYEDTKLGQGRSNACNLLADNPELLEEIEMIIQKGLDK